MAIETNTTTDVSSSLPAPLPSLKDAFAIRREIFVPVPSADEQGGELFTLLPDFMTALMRDGVKPHALGGWTLAGIAVSTVALEWLARVL